MKAKKILERGISILLSGMMLMGIMVTGGSAQETTDFSGLDTALAQARSVARDEYSAASYASLQNAITQADATANKASASQSEVDGWTSTLLNSLNALSDPQARTRLSELITNLKRYDGLREQQNIETDIFTAETVSAFRAALKSAEAVLEDHGADDYALNQTIAALKAVNSQLELEAKPRLLAEIAEARAFSAGGHVAAGLAQLQEAIEAAAEASEQTNPLLYHLDYHIKSLTSAQEVVIPLHDKLAEAKAIQPGNYTAASYDNLQSRIKSLESALESLKSNPSYNYTSALNNLNAAIDALTGETPADKTALNAKIQEAKALNPADYTVPSNTYLQGVIASAEAVANDADATQTETDAQLTQLTNVLKYLTSVSAAVSKDALLSKMLEAAAIGPGDYSSASYSALTTALASARSTLGAANPNQTTVDNRLTALQNAIDGLATRSQAFLNAYNTAATAQQGDYAAAAFRIVQKALTDAAATKANYDNGQAVAAEDAEYHITALTNSVAMLAKRTTAAAALDQAKAVNPDSYEAGSFAGLQDAVAEMEAAFNDPTVPTSGTLSYAFNNAVTKLQTYLAHFLLAKLTPLANGTYAVPVSIQNAGNPANPSMANDVVDKTAIIRVKDGQASAFVKMGTLDFAGVGMLYGNLLRLYYYNDRGESVGSDAASIAMEAVKLSDREALRTESTGPDGYIVYTTVPEWFRIDLPYYNASDLYIAVNVDMMIVLGMPYQNAILRFDYTNAQAITNTLDLELELDQARTVARNNYTAESFAALQNSIDDGQAVLDSAEAIQAEADAALASLRGAVEGLMVFTLDKSALNARLLEAKAIGPGNYTQESYNALQAAIASAQSVADTERTTQEQVDAQAAALEGAIAALKERPTGILEDGVYSIPVWALKQNGETSMAAGAIEPNAKLVVNGSHETLTLTFKPMTLPSFGVTGHLLYGAVFPTRADFQAYNTMPSDVELYTTAATVDSTYVDEVFGTEAGETMEYPQKLTFTVPNDEGYNGQAGFMFYVVVDAMKVFNPGAPNAGAAEMVLKLDYDNAVLIPDGTVDKSALSTKVQEAKAIAQGDYTDESYAALQSAITAAEEILNNDAATKEQVDTQYTALVDAINALTEKTDGSVDKEALSAKLAEAKGISKGNYTDESYSALQTAIAEAEAVLNSEDATQAQVNAKLSALTGAINALKTNPTTPSGPLDKDNLANGKYEVQVDLWHATVNKASMGNGSLNHTGLLEVKDGVYTVTVSVHPMTVGTITASLLTLQIKQADGAYVFADVAANHLPGGKPSAFQFVLPGKGEFLDVLIDPQVEVMGKDPIPARLKFSWNTLKAVPDDTQVDDNTDTSNGGVQTPSVSLTDSATGVRIEADENILVSGVQLGVTSITSGADYEAAGKALEEIGEKFVLFDLTLLSPDGSVVQPNGLVKVSLPVPSGYDISGLALYRINDDGTKTLITGTVEDGYYVFYANHFSKYALVEQDSRTVDSGDVPETGDAAPFAPMAIGALALMAVGALAAGGKKRKAGTKA